MPNSTTTTSTTVTSDGNNVRPGQRVEASQPGGRHRKLSGPLAGAVKSVSDRISSSVSKVTDGLKGGRAETGEDNKDSVGVKGE